MILLLAVACIFCNDFIEGSLIRHLFLKEPQKKDNSDNKKWKSHESSMQQWHHFDTMFYGAPIHELQYGNLFPLINAWNDYGVMFHCIDNMYGHMYAHWKPEIPDVTTATTTVMSSTMPSTEKHKTTKGVQHSKSNAGITPRRLIRRRNFGRRKLKKFPENQDYSIERYDDLPGSSDSDNSDSDYADDIDYEYRYDLNDSEESEDNRKDSKRSRRIGHRGISFRNRNSRRRNSSKKSQSNNETQLETSEHEDQIIRNKASIHENKKTSLVLKKEDENSASEEIENKSSENTNINFSSKRRGQSKISWKQ